METLNLTQDQLNQISNLILELPTKYGLPIFNLITSFIDKSKKTEEAKQVEVEEVN
jgi:hypothetical protein